MPYVIDTAGEDKPPKVPSPVAGPRPDKGPMTNSELQSLVDGLISTAALYIDGELSPDRALATDYYYGRPFGNEEPGRSSFVSTEVRDGIQAVLPSMLRVVFGSENAVEFVPRSAEDVDAAEQATDYVQMVFAEDNPGFLNTMAWAKDGLIRKTGVAKWWWDKTTEVTNHKFENVSQAGLELLASDEELELTRIEETGQDEMGQPLHTVEGKRTVVDGRARWEVLPPEEFLYNRESRDPRSAVSLWHRTRKTRGELIAMGVPEKMIDEHGGDDPAVKDSLENIARNPNETTAADEAEAGKANERHLYCEGFARIDYDGDGVAELRKICALGPGHYPVVNDPADDINFAIFVPDPEPHTMTGQSWADRLMDLQRYKSMLMRGLSDSLAASIFPRVVYQHGNANLADILNTAMGAPIRATGDPNTAVREFAHTFLGKEALPIIDLVDSINERRTGQNRGAGQLDADALQSSTPAAVTAALSAAQAQQEMLVRIFAETGLKQLFKGLLKLLVTHQPRARMVRLRNRWVEVDPRSWDVDMDVRVNVALGAGLVEEKIQTLGAIAEKQSEILEKMGLDNPIVGVKELRDTLAEMAELRGKRDSSRYFKPISREQEQMMAQQRASQPPQQSPEMVLAQAQMETTKMKVEADIRNQELKAQRDLMTKQAEMSMRWREIQMEDQRERERQRAEDDRERDKQAAEIQLELKKLEVEYHANLNEAQVNADIERERMITQSSPTESASYTDSEGNVTPPRSRRRHMTVHRGPDGKLVGATVEDLIDDVGQE